MILSKSLKCPSFFLTNARSILPKIDELRLSAVALHADVLIITESWLHEDIDSNLLFLNGYYFFRCDRKWRKGGGVCIWAKSTFLPLFLSTQATLPAFIELCLVRLSCNAFCIICCGIYVPPGLSKNDHNVISDFLISEFDHLLSLFPDDKFVIAGDFNDFQIEFLRENFNLVNCVTKATRGEAILDFICIDENLSAFYPDTADVGPPLKNSDHNCILLSPLRTLSPADSSQNRRPTLVWDFRDSNVCEYLRRLSLVDFDVITKENTVNDMCSKLYDLLTECLLAIPCEPVLISSRDKPWMTPILKLLIDKRWRAFREGNWAAYIHYKAKVSTEIKNAKRIWCQKKLKSPRGLWSVVNSLRGTHSKDPWQRLLSEHGDLKTLVMNVTAEFYRNYNADVDVDLLPLTGKTWNFSISPENVFQHLSRLNLRKAIGPDQIPPFLLKVGADFLCQPLAEIFNFSIVTETFPALFKHAHVCPIPKSPLPGLGDFRPISLLSPISKIFERLILDHIQYDLFQCYGSNQHAYRPLGSTTTALTEFCEHVTEALDFNLTSSVNIFCLDLSKAFDKLQHHRLLNFLSNCGLNHGFLRWLLSYLSLRPTNVKIMNTFGPTVVTPSGVPQGSVLGPVLFAAYMGSINFPATNIKCVKYADDVSIIEPLSRPQNSSVTLDLCESVFKDKGLLVNRSKCKLMRVCRSRVLDRKESYGFSEVTSMKILGVIFTDRFKWDAQISEILRKASKRLYLIRRLKEYLDNKELARVYHAVITSLFLYASPVYGCLPSTLLSKLERFQKRAHRLICGPLCDCDLFPSINSLQQGAAVKLLLRSEVDPNHPLHCFVPSRLPASNKLRMPVCSSNRRLHSFFPWATQLLNTLS